MNSDKSDSSRLPFNLFDERIPFETISQTLQNRFELVSKEGTLNPFDPENEFEKVFRQALDTSHTLLDITEDEYKKLDPRKKLQHVKCINVIHHILGTPAAVILGSTIAYEVYVLNDFYSYFIYKILERYNGGELPNMQDFVHILNKSFVTFILTNITKKKKLNNKNLHLGNWIDMYADQDHERLSRSRKFEDIKLDFEIGITLEQEMADLDHEYIMEIVGQTLVWYLLRWTNPKKLKLFKYQPLNLDSLIQCYSESIYENQISLEA